MAILIMCQCGKPLRASDGYIGRQARCPNCGRIHEVTATGTGQSSAQAVAAAETPAPLPERSNAGSEEALAQPQPPRPSGRLPGTAVVATVSLVLAAVAITVGVLVMKKAGRQNEQEGVSSGLLPRLGQFGVGAGVSPAGPGAQRQPNAAAPGANGTGNRAGGGPPIAEPAGGVANLRLRELPIFKAKGGCLRGHRSAVTSVAFSPDGQFALSGGCDGMVCLWDLTHRTKVRTMDPLEPGEPPPVSSVALSHDGKWAASGGSDKLVHLWEVATGKDTSAFFGHTQPISSLAFSPDDQWILSGSEDATVRLWDVPSGEEVRRFEGFNGPVSCVTFSPDGQRAAACGWNEFGTLVWDVASGTLQKSLFLEGHNDKVTSVAFSPDGRYLLTGGLDRHVLLWDVEAGSLKTRFDGPAKQIFSVAFTPDGRYAAAGVQDGTIRFWEVATGTEVRKAEGHTDEVRCVTFSPDGHQSLSGSKDSTIQLWGQRRDVEFQGVQFGALVGP